MPPVEEVIEIPALSFPPLVDMLFSHMNSVNQWINGFSMSNEGIQNDINTIRVYLISFFFFVINNFRFSIGSS